MDVKNVFLGLLFAGCSALMLTSCETNDVYDPSRAPRKTEDLVVPDGFEWKTSQDVTISMTAPHATSVTVYTDKSCTRQIARLPVAKGESSIAMEVPLSTSSIWFEYAVAGGGKEIMEVPIQKAVTRATSGAASWTTNVIFPDKIDNSEIASMVIYQPAKDGFGTIMFEDSWPEKADYDFNDFVMNYNIKAEGHLADNGGFDYTDLTITLKLRAMGGSLPYRFCMQIGHRLATDAGVPAGTESATTMGLLKTDIRDFKVINNPLGGNMELLDGTDRVILALTGFDGLKGISGGSFYNTEKAHLYTGEVPTLTFTLRLDEKRITSIAGHKPFFEGFGAQSAFDYFLQKTDGSNREIHLIDWMPTELYKNYEADAGITSSPDVYYCSNKNFVWALKVPEEIAWPVEYQDISGVYPYFSDWIKRGGDYLENSVDNIVWYKQDNKFLTHDADLYIKPW